MNHQTTTQVHYIELHPPPPEKKNEKGYKQCTLYLMHIRSSICCMYVAYPCNLNNYFFISQKDPLWTWAIVLFIFIYSIVKYLE